MIDFIPLMDPKILRLDKSDQFFEDSDWVQELKVTGRRIQCLVNDNGISFAGRYARDTNENISDLRWKFFKIYDDIVKMALPKGTLIDGEIYLPSQPVSHTMQIINSSIDDAIRLQEQQGFLLYAIFDILAFNNQLLTDQSLQHRRQKLTNVISPTCNIEIMQWLTKTNDKRSFWQQLLESDKEEKGVVFKFIESDYESTRSKWWRKLKKFETYDGVILGFKFHNKYPEDFVASIDVGQYRNNQLIHIANVGGLTKEQASDFRSNMQSYVGKVVEFRSELKTELSYKTPRFDCMRLDKQPQSCVWED